MNLFFDPRGNLQPEGLIDCTIDEFKVFFVDQFGDNEARKGIFEHYLHYNHDLQQLLGTGFTQWIDGSFISTKSLPRDIDFVTFIDWQIYGKLEKDIDAKFGKWQVGNHYPHLDAYTICEYPIDHKFHPVFLADLVYWQDWFGHTRYNHAKRKFPKGFIQIKIA